MKARGRREDLPAVGFAGPNPSRTSGPLAQACGRPGERRRWTSRIRPRLPGMAAAGPRESALPRYRCRRRCRSIDFAGPERHQRAVRRKTQRANRRIDELRNATARQVVELAGPDLGDPDVHPSVAIRQKRHESAVARDGGGLLDAARSRSHLKPRVADAGCARSSPFARGATTSPTSPSKQCPGCRGDQTSVDRRHRRRTRRRDGIGDVVHVAAKPADRLVYRARSCRRVTGRFRLRVHPSSSVRKA